MIQAQIVYVTAQQKMTTLPVPAHGVSIGRAAGCTIVTADPQVSQQHASIKLIRDAWHIEDQRSRNGTLLNRNRVTAPTRLRHLDIIECGSLQLRFVLTSGAENATLAEGQRPQLDATSSNFEALRSEIAKIKNERDELLEKLEQQGRALSGANAENRQLRQAQDELRDEQVALRKNYELVVAAQNALSTAAQKASADKEREAKQASELKEQLRTLQADLAQQKEGRRQAELEAQRLKDLAESAETECERLKHEKEEAISCANQRIADVDALGRLRSDWDRYKMERDAESRINAVRINELMSELDAKQAALRTAQNDLSNLRERYDEKNGQHRGLRNEFDQLSAELVRHQDQAKRQLERLAKDKESLHTQMQALRLELEKAQKASPQKLTEGALKQLGPELAQVQRALVQENEQLRRLLSRTLRWYAREPQSNSGEPMAQRIRDTLEAASAQAEQTNKSLQELDSVCAAWIR